MTWLIAIARNRAIDHLRVRGQNRRMDPIEEAANLADDKPTAEVALQGAQEQAQLQRCLDGLAGQRARGVARCVFRRQHLRRACRANESAARHHEKLDPAGDDQIEGLSGAMTDIGDLEAFSADELSAAEYALGVLAGAERAAAAQRVARDRAFAALVAAWKDRRL
jgi:hypothetical protein